MRGLLNYFSVICLWGMFSANAIAKNGDTLKITTHNKVLIQTDPSRGVTDYYAWGKFPKAGNYQRMIAELTFQCPTGMTCGEWDYNNHIRIGKRKGTYNDSLGWEIMRLITPYGLGFSSTWKHTWTYDITDFQQLFRDSVEIWYQHSGYEARNGRGWVITLTFTMTEGPSVRPVLDLKRMYSVWAGYGNDSLFDRAVPEFNWTSPANAETSRIKIIQTGHGMDKPENCAEFCPKKRYLVLDSQKVDESYVWRDDCGSNPVFPQNGTWLYDRSNWCPGQSVREYNFEFVETPGKKHSFDLDMESYVRTGGGSNYVITSYLVTYGKKSYQKDVRIEDILKPTTNPQYQRMNPVCNRPLIQLKNQGSKTVNNVVLHYGIRGGKHVQYTWAGILEFNQVVDVVLPIWMDWDKTSSEFEVYISEVDGSKDEESFNDTMRSSLPAQTPTLPNKIVVVFKTNNAPTENSYTFRDMDGKAIFRKDNFTLKNTVYRDTYQFNTGCYTFQFYDTGAPNPDYQLNEDGIVWWANTTDGNGSLQLRNANSGALIKNFSGDFGTDIIYDFTVGYTLKTIEYTKKSGQLKLQPNPAHGSFGLDVSEIIAENTKNATIEICDLQGKLLKFIELKQGFSLFQWIQVPELPAGIYFVNFKQNNEIRTQKLVLF